MAEGGPKFSPNTEIVLPPVTGIFAGVTRVMVGGSYEKADVRSPVVKFVRNTETASTTTSICRGPSGRTCRNVAVRAAA